MLTKLFPMVQFKKDTWEIDEFDVASIFLLVGTEKALVIDTGMGIGDLRGAIEMITDKPLICAVSHGHIDHTGNCRQFEEVWINPADQAAPIPQDTVKRRFDTELIARRQKGAIGAPFTMFNLYPYDIDTDIRDAEDEPVPVLRDLVDGTEFDLGGGRIVTAFECPGHTKGEMVFLDHQTRTLIAGDALNFNLGVREVPIERALKALKRIDAMKDSYDGIYNGHHDFRAFGAPLDDDCMTNVIAMMEDCVAGHIVPCETPSFWGQNIPLRPGEKVNPMKGAPPNNPLDAAKPPMRMATLRRGRNFLNINLDNIYE